MVLLLFIKHFFCQCLYYYHAFLYKFLCQTISSFVLSLFIFYSLIVLVDLCAIGVEGKTICWLWTFPVNCVVVILCNFPFLSTYFGKKHNYTLFCSYFCSILLFMKFSSIYYNYCSFLYPIESTINLINNVLLYFFNFSISILVLI